MKVYFAQTFWQRAVGMLLGRGAKPGSCLVLSPCNDIHTMGMRWPIDVAFVDERGVVLRSVLGMKPFRRKCCPKAFSVIERRACEDSWFRVGERIAWSSAALCSKGKRRRRQ